MQPLRPGQGRWLSRTKGLAGHSGKCGDPYQEVLDNIIRQRDKGVSRRLVRVLLSAQEWVILPRKTQQRAD